MGIVTVEVLDAAGAKQQFCCEMGVLSEGMGLFKSMLEGTGPGRDIRLKVHCDLKVFSWILRYARAQRAAAASSAGGGKAGSAEGSSVAAAPPALQVNDCLEVLVASSFLQMPVLLALAIEFAANHIRELVAAVPEPAAVDGLPLELLARVAQATSEEDLEDLHNLTTGTAPGRRARVVERLFKAKLEALLAAHGTTLHRCLACGQLFSRAAHNKLQPPGSLQRHRIDEGWILSQHLRSLRRQARWPYRGVYWNVWGAIQVLYCGACHKHYPAREHLHCSFHPQEAVFGLGTDSGVYPCCGLCAWQPGMPRSASAGCQAREHQVSLPAAEAEDAAMAAAGGEVGAVLMRPASPDAAAGRPPRPSAAVLSLLPAGLDHGQMRQQVERWEREAWGRYLRSPQRALQLLARFEGLIAVPYQPPPNPVPPAPEASRAAALEEPSGDRSAHEAASQEAASTVTHGACDGCTASSGKQAGAPAFAQPLLSRLVLRGSSPATVHSGREAEGGGAHLAALTAMPQLSLPVEMAARASAGATKASVRSAAAAGGGGDSGEHWAGFRCDEEESELDYRSSHLAGFVAAVREAARQRHRVPASQHAAGGAAGDGALGALGAGFSRGGKFSLANTPRKPSEAAAQRPGAAAAVPVQEARAGPPGFGAGGAAVAQQAALASRSMLLELVRDDDAFRVGLLMRRLDRVRLQPLPDPGSHRTRGGCGGGGGGKEAAATLQVGEPGGLLEGVAGGGGGAGGCESEWPHGWRGGLGGDPGESRTAVSSSDTRSSSRASSYESS